MKGKLHHRIIAFASALMLSITALPSGGYAATQAPPPLLASWSFENCMGQDGSGNNNNAVLDGQYRCVKGIWVNKSNTRAIRFVNRAGRAVVNDSPSISGLSQMTLSLWLRNWGNGTLVQYGAWCPDGAHPSKGFAYALELTPQSNVKMSVIGNSGAVSDPMNRIISQGHITNDGRWHHLAATFNQGDLAVYIDGKKDVATTLYFDSGGSAQQPVAQTLFTRIADISDRLQIGNGYAYCLGNTTDFDYGFNGTLDEVKIYGGIVVSNGIAGLVRDVNAATDAE